MPVLATTASHEDLQQQEASSAEFGGIARVYLNDTFVEVAAEEVKRLPWGATDGNLDDSDEEDSNDDDDDDDATTSAVLLLYGCSHLSLQTRASCGSP